MFFWIYSYHVHLGIWCKVCLIYRSRECKHLPYSHMNFHRVLEPKKTNEKLIFILSSKLFRTLDFIPLKRVIIALLVAAYPTTARISFRNYFSAIINAVFSNVIFEQKQQQQWELINPHPLNQKPKSICPSTLSSAPTDGCEKSHYPTHNEEAFFIISKYVIYI